MLKSKSFTLEKPKQSEGWIKIQEWDRRWNKILAIIFGVLSFMLLFAIVLANTMSTAAVPPPTAAPNLTTTPTFESTTDLSTTETTDWSTITDFESTTLDEETDGIGRDYTEISSAESNGSMAVLEFCFMVSCNITCANGRINRLTEIIDTLYKMSRCWVINLEINHCSFPRRTISRNWLTTKALIFTLKIVNTHVEYIKDRAFVSSCFEKLQTLVIKNANIRKLCSRNTFKCLRNLQRLELINLPLSMFRNEVFTPFATTLRVLVFEEMSTTDFPVQNITGNFSGSLPNLTYLSLKYNRLAPLNENSFVALEKISEMDLAESNIAVIGRGTFDHLKSLKKLSLNGNNIASIPDKIFDTILKIEGALINLLGNPLICNCGLRQLQRYLDTPETTYMFASPLTCILPSECWEEFVMDCNICDKSVRPTPSPPTFPTEESTEMSPLKPTESITSSEKPPSEKPHNKEVACFNKAGFITLTIMSLLLSASVGAVCLFCGIRHCPTLIKRAKFTIASKKSSTSEVVAFPSRASATPRSSTSKPPFLRSHSDTSIASGRSYVSAISPHNFSNISWRMDKENYIYQNSIYLENNFFDRPPPLPPHPRRNSSLTTDAPSTRTTCTYSTNENIYELYE